MCSSTSSQQLALHHIRAHNDDIDNGSRNKNQKSKLETNKQVFCMHEKFINKFRSRLNKN